MSENNKPSAPRITPADIEDNIVAEHHFTAGAALKALGHPVSPEFHQMSLCVLMLRNGTKIVGVNHGAIDPAQHDAERGMKDARKDAINQIWQLMGYELRSKLAAQ